jgi:hypothetical protein
MALAPVWFLAYLGMAGRATTYVWQSPEYGPKGEEIIANYREPMALYYELGVAEGKAEPDEIREVARAWIALHEQGQLQPIPLLTLQDHTDEKLKHEIFFAKGKLVGSLKDQLNEALDRDAPPEEICDLALEIIELSEVAKYSDLSSIIRFAYFQRAAADVLQKAAKRLDDQERAHYGSRLAEATMGTGSLEETMRAVKRAYVWDHRRQILASGRSHDEGDGAPALDRLTLLASTHDPGIVFTDQHTRFLMPADGHLQDVSMRVRQATQYEADYRLAYRNALEQLARAQ